MEKDSGNQEILYRDIVRLSPEPCRSLDDREVHALLTDRPQEYYRFVLQELNGMAEGRIAIDLPPKQVFEDQDGLSDFRLMPCIVRAGSSIRKTVKIVGTNVRQQTVPDQITVGKALALHPQENFITHIFDACLLSSARTGICAAIAADLLSRSRQRVTIVGAGRVAYYAALYTVSLGGVEEVCFSDTAQERAARAAEFLGQQIGTVRFSADEQAGAGETDVLILATTSTAPVCSPPGMNANLIISLGADTDYQRELDPAWAASADIFVDTMDSARYGDLNAWQRTGVVSPGQFTDLFGVLRGGASATSQRQRIFVSTGSALFDNITIGYLLGRVTGR